MPACVGDAVREHLLFNNAQLGAGHAISDRSTDAVTEAHNVVKVSLLSGDAAGHVLCVAQGWQKAVGHLLSWEQSWTSMAATRERPLLTWHLAAAEQQLLSVEHGPRTYPARLCPPAHRLLALKKQSQLLAA